jgi:hypothetical protein
MSIALETNRIPKDFSAFSSELAIPTRTSLLTRVDFEVEAQEIRDLQTHASRMKFIGAAGTVIGALAFGAVSLRLGVDANQVCGSIVFGGSFGGYWSAWIGLALGE